MPETSITPALHEVERAVLGAMIVYPEEAAKPVIEAALAGIMNESGSPANIMHHIGLLKEKAALRKLALLGSVLKNRAETPGADPEELIVKVETQCAEIREFTGKTAFLLNIKPFILRIQKTNHTET